VKLEYIVQEEQLGLAHATGLAKDFVGSDPFCLFLGDNIFQDKMESLIRAFPNSDTEATIIVGEVSDPTRFGIAEVTNGRIINVVEKPPEPRSNLAIAGIYLFRPSIFQSISQIPPSARGEYEITDAIQHLISSSHHVTPYIIEGWWIDAGKPDAIIRANQLVLGELPYSPPPEGTDQIVGNCEISPRVALGEGTKIIDSVIRGPVIIGCNVTIRNSYIGPYTSIGDNSVIEDSEIDASIVMKDCAIRSISGRIDSSLLADNSILTSAAVLVPSVRRFVLAENSYVQL
jgi:glucose-1-phosphate thymidylyltransferase